MIFAEDNPTERIQLGVIETDSAARAELVSLIASDPGASSTIEIAFMLDSIKPLINETQLPPPDVLLLNPAGQHSACVKQLKKQYPGLSIVIMSSNVSIENIKHFLRDGSLSFISKPTTTINLKCAVFMTYEGGSFLSPDVCRSLIDQSHKVGEREDILTARETQIVKSLAQGCSYKMIAQSYNISLNTVRVYIKRIYGKFRVNSRTELMHQLSV